MEDYKPNSNRFKAEEKEAAKVEKKQISPVVTKPVKIRKKSELSKLSDVFTPGDVNNVKSYVLMEVLVPAIKKAISDIITNGCDMLLYGDTAPKKSRSRSDKVSYRDYYDRDDRKVSSHPISTRYSYDEIVLDTRSEAEEVLERMDELLETYGMVSVADLYDLVGMSCEYTDNKYGWTNLRSADVIHVRDGFLLKLPRPYPIN